MRAWHNSPELKAEVLARMLQHRVEDSIVQGQWQEFAPELASQYRGCLIGCTLPKNKVLVVEPGCGVENCNCAAVKTIAMYDNPIKEVETQYGILLSIGRLVERVFEALPVEKAAWFAVAFIEAVPVGVDLEPVSDVIEQELRRIFRDNRPVRPTYGNTDVRPLRLCRLFNRNYDPQRRHPVEVAEMIIRVLKESEPNPTIPFETVADVEEDARVSVA
jgi:hypothetical protein